VGLNAASYCVELPYPLKNHLFTQSDGRALGSIYQHAKRAKAFTYQLLYLPTFLIRVLTLSVAFSAMARVV